MHIRVCVPFCKDKSSIPTLTPSDSFPFSTTEKSLWKYVFWHFVLLFLLHFDNCKGTPHIISFCRWQAVINIVASGLNFSGRWWVSAFKRGGGFVFLSWCHRTTINIKDQHKNWTKKQTEIYIDLCNDNGCLWNNTTKIKWNQRKRLKRTARGNMAEVSGRGDLIIICMCSFKLGKIMNKCHNFEQHNIRISKLQYFFFG